MWFRQTSESLTRTGPKKLVIIGLLLPFHSTGYHFTCPARFDMVSTGTCASIAFCAVAAVDDTTLVVSFASVCYS